ncbi:hypothetical protein, partial [Streptomyces sp. RP5T]|uniref:hypothetical protein n=1 Tax=Streptomyces sp. RP5T TaxID=2490848 RepID=UPI001C8B331A
MGPEAAVKSPVVEEVVGSGEAGVSTDSMSVAGSVRSKRDWDGEVVGVEGGLYVREEVVGVVVG